MRLIKFRGKRFTNGEWVYGSLIAFDGFCQIVVPPKGDDPFENCSIAVIPESIGQYAGVNDVEDHEIWEGDLIKYGNDAPTEVVFKSDGCFTFKGCELPLGRFHISKMQVIGNIHDHKNLLEK